MGKSSARRLNGEKYSWDNSIDETKANYNNNVWNGRVKGEGQHGTTMPVGATLRTVTDCTTWRETCGSGV